MRLLSKFAKRKSSSLSHNTSGENERNSDKKYRKYFVFELNNICIIRKANNCVFNECISLKRKKKEYDKHIALRLPPRKKRREKKKHCFFLPLSLNLVCLKHKKRSENFNSQVKPKG